ncbi:MAG TPA: hydrogenase maturation protease, partial [Myxococcales bacterium]|nr:hydrogenase maturation protease [Myxococcales bacterium]
EVARRLSTRVQPDGVRVEDYGIRGYDLTYALLESWDAVVLVDAVRRGAAPGTLFVIEPEAGGGSTEPVLDAHGMDPERVLSAVAALGGELKCLRVVGCEPQDAGSEEEMAVGLSPPVEAAVEPAVELVESVVRELEGTASVGAGGHA